MKFAQQLRADGQQVAARQFQNLPLVPEAGPHDFGFMAERLVVAINLPHGFDTRVVGGRKIPFLFRLMPVQNPADERGNEPGLRLRASDRLRQREQQRHVAVNGLLLQHLGGANPFPARCNLDKHPLPRNSVLRIKRNEPARLVNQALRVEGEIGVRFR